jgi:hypothetical protein
MGKKSEDVLTGADDAEWISKGGQAAGRPRGSPHRGGLTHSHLEEEEPEKHDPFGSWQQHGGSRSRQGDRRAARQARTGLDPVAIITQDEHADGAPESRSAR